jgi:5-methylcytosine-specific restriction endonuclease McrA
MIRRACSVCGGIAEPGSNRCARHPKTPRRRDRAYTTYARQLVATATRCAICGGPPTPDDPLVCDHIIPIAHGGPNTTDNLQPAHRSCNGRKGHTISESRLLR